jgi:hypothetical protein
MVLMMATVLTAVVKAGVGVGVRDARFFKVIHNDSLTHLAKSILRINIFPEIRNLYQLMWDRSVHAKCDQTCKKIFTHIEIYCLEENRKWDEYTLQFTSFIQNINLHTRMSKHPTNTLATILKSIQHFCTFF